MAAGLCKNTLTPTHYVRVPLECNYKNRVPATGSISYSLWRSRSYIALSSSLINPIRHKRGKSMNRSSIFTVVHGYRFNRIKI
jgi:hypothetical protein